jgi:hypothetical protein
MGFVIKTHNVKSVNRCEGHIHTCKVGVQIPIWHPWGNHCTKLAETLYCAMEWQYVFVL